MKSRLAETNFARRSRLAVCFGCESGCPAVSPHEALQRPPARLVDGGEADANPMADIPTDHRARVHAADFDPGVERLAIEQHAKVAPRSDVERIARGQKRAAGADVQHLGVHDYGHRQMDGVRGSDSRMTAAFRTRVA
jgi:hypothetical protein